MGTSRLLPLRFKNAASHLLQKFRLYSSSAAVIRRPWTHLADEPEESDGKSAVYRRALKLQRPSTVKFQENLLNTVSLIGVIGFPFKEMNTGGRFGVHTSLKFKLSTGAYPDSTIMLQMWDEVAEMSLQHLKPNDLIYVSGPIYSYKKASEDEKLVYRYKMIVKEINFVARHGLCPSSGNPVKLEPQVSAEDILQKRRIRLHLWQVFFSSPYDWWDNRNNKRNPRCPDFTHKDTGEALWLKDFDPPWVKKQLELHDSGFNKPRKHTSTWSHLSPLFYDDTKGN